MFEYILGALPHFLAYFGTAVALGVAFIVLYSAVTPLNEFTLIKQGQTAPAISLVGAFIGFAIPLAIVIGNSVSVPDVVFWGAIVLLIQLAVFFITSKIFSGIAKKLEEDCLASGVFLAGMSIGVGILNAACMVP